MARPVMLVVAGPPGSGKTMFFPASALGVDAFNRAPHPPAAGRPASGDESRPPFFSPLFTPPPRNEQDLQAASGRAPGNSMVVCPGMECFPTALTKCPRLPTGRLNLNGLGALLLGHDYQGAFMMLGRGHPRRSRGPTVRYR